jgi:predicted MFS family arabinose efflux permease
MSVYALIGLFFSIGLGSAMARWGPPRFLLLAFAAVMSGNLLALAAPEQFLVMFISRAFEGLGFAVFAIIGPVYASRNAAAQHLPVAIALSAIWIPVGQLTANALTPIATAVNDWRVLWFAGFALAVGFALWTIWIRYHKQVDLSAGLHTAAAAAVTAHSRAENRFLIVTAIIFTLWSGQYFAYMTWLPLFLIDVHGFDQTASIIGYSVPVCLLIVFSLVTAALLKRGGSVAVLLMISLILQAFVWLSMSWATYPLFGLASLVIYGVGIGIAPVCLFALPSTILGAERSGPKAFAILMTGRNLGVLIGPILLPQIVTYFVDWDVNGWIFGSITTVAMALALSLVIGLKNRTA